MDETRYVSASDRLHRFHNIDGQQLYLELVYSLLYCLKKLCITKAQTFHQTIAIFDAKVNNNQPFVPSDSSSNSSE